MSTNCAGIFDQLDKAFPFAATFLRDMPRGGGGAFVAAGFAARCRERQLK